MKSEGHRAKSYVEPFFKLFQSLMFLLLCLASSIYCTCGAQHHTVPNNLVTELQFLCWGVMRKKPFFRLPDGRRLKRWSLMLWVLCAELTAFVLCGSTATVTLGAVSMKQWLRRPLICLCAVCWQNHTVQNRFCSAVIKTDQQLLGQVWVLGRKKVPMSQK